MSTLERRCASLPIFPLPRTVLLPGAALPLHVFEERYRALVEHCMQGDRLLGIATLKPGYEASYAASPAIWPEIGVGEIVAHQPISTGDGPEGRCNIVLRYVGRGLLAEELLSPHLFRLVRCELPPLDDRGLDSALANLKLLVLQLGGLTPAGAAEAERLVQLDGTELVDALARRLLEEPDEQRSYLGALRATDRVAAVADRLAAFISARAVGEG
jgi:Lon protease-like protein